MGLTAGRRRYSGERDRRESVGVPFLRHRVVEGLRDRMERKRLGLAGAVCLRPQAVEGEWAVPPWAAVRRWVAERLAEAEPGVPHQAQNEVVESYIDEQLCGAAGLSYSDMKERYPCRMKI